MYTTLGLARIFLAVIAGLFLVALVGVGYALAQPTQPFNCVPGGMEAFERNLRAKWREHLVIEALTAGGELFRVYVSAEGTWTLITLTPEGVACLRSAGDGFLFRRGQGEPS